MPEQTRLAEVIPQGQQSSNLPAAYYPPMMPGQEFVPEAPSVPLRTISGYCAGIAGRSSPLLHTSVLMAALFLRASADL